MDKKGYYEVSRDIQRICSVSKRVKLFENINHKESSEKTIVDSETIEEFCMDTNTIEDNNFISDISESESDIYSDFSCADEEKNLNFASDIAKWFVEFRISEAAGNGLLQVLRKLHPNLPQNIKTLIKVPNQTSTNITSMVEGHYSHIGLREKLQKHVCMHKLKELVLKLDIGIDGVPLTKSSNSQLWPILANIMPYKEVFLVGIFHGYKKPTCPNAFIQPFVDEMEELEKNPILYKGKPVKVEVRAFICDAPARSFILGELNGII